MINDYQHSRDNHCTKIGNKQAIGSWTTKGQQIDVFLQNLHFYTQVKIRQTIL